MNQKLRDNNLLMDLGLQPVSNRFKKNKYVKSPKFPFKVNISKNTGLISLKEFFPVHEVVPRYDWITCMEPEAHLDKLISILIKLPGISKKSVIGSFSFKDISTLQRLKKKGFKNLWNIHPEKDLGIKNKKCSVETLQSKFNLNIANKLRRKYSLADIIIVRHVIEHAYDINNFVSSIKALTKNDGYIVWELPDCKKSLRKLDYTMLWEEHTHYFTEFTLKNFLKNQNFDIVNFISYPYAFENSLVAIVKHKENNVHKNDFKFSRKLKIELSQAKSFANSLHVQKKKIKRKLYELKKKYHNANIALYGAGHLSVAFISIMQLSKMVSYVIDDNLNKKGMIMPVGNIPIISSKELIAKNIKICLLSLNPMNHLKIIKKNKNFVKNGGIFLSIFPGSNYYVGETK